MVTLLRRGRSTSREPLLQEKAVFFPGIQHGAEPQNGVTPCDARPTAYPRREDVLRGRGGAGRRDAGDQCTHPVRRLPSVGVRRLRGLRPRTDGRGRRPEATAGVGRLARPPGRRRHRRRDGPRRGGRLAASFVLEPRRRILRRGRNVLRRGGTRARLAGSGPRFRPLASDRGRGGASVQVPARRVCGPRRRRAALL
jgi:hypothetical protein